MEPWLKIIFNGITPEQRVTILQILTNLRFHVHVDLSPGPAIDGGFADPNPFRSISYSEQQTSTVGVCRELSEISLFSVHD